MRPNFPALFAAIVGVAVAGCTTDRNPTVPVVVRDTVATYTVRFTSTWSSTTHPVDFPSASAHYSDLIGATHSSGVVFWREGQLASPGIQAMAELGATGPLSTEIAVAIAAGTTRDTLLGDGLRPSPGQLSLDFQIRDTHSLVTLVTMIAPSPDWFVGVADLPLLVNDQWVDSLTVVLRGWDAGTDDGATYIAMNAPSTPHVPIFRLETGPFLVGGVVPPLGDFTFIRHR